MTISRVSFPIRLKTALFFIRCLCGHDQLFHLCLAGGNDMLAVPGIGVFCIAHLIGHLLLLYLASGNNFRPFPGISLFSVSGLGGNLLHLYLARGNYPWPLPGVSLFCLVATFSTYPLHVAIILRPYSALATSSIRVLFANSSTSVLHLHRSTVDIMQD